MTTDIISPVITHSLILQMSPEGLLCASWVLQTSCISQHRAAWSRAPPSRKVPIVHSSSPKLLQILTLSSTLSGVPSSSPQIILRVTISFCTASLQPIYCSCAPRGTDSGLAGLGSRRGPPPRHPKPHSRKAHCGMHTPLWQNAPHHLLDTETGLFR